MRTTSKKSVRNKVERRRQRFHVPFSGRASGRTKRTADDAAVDDSRLVDGVGRGVLSITLVGGRGADASLASAISHRGIPALGINDGSWARRDFT